METLHAFAEWLVEFVHEFGYWGIFIMTFLESTFVPIPAEVTMVPAGYLVEQGHMNFWLVMFSSIAGTIGGSLANYYIAAHYGRRFLYHFGKYMFLPHEKLDKLDQFFASHGEVSIFTARLFPGIRHVISFPAGLAHMDLKRFVFYTGTGGGLWMATLVLIGYLIGDNKALIKHYMPYVVGAFVIGAIVMIMWYMRWHRKKTAEKSNG